MTATTDLDPDAPPPHLAEETVGDVIGRSGVDAVAGPGDLTTDTADEATGDRICRGSEGATFRDGGVGDLVLVLDRAGGVEWMSRCCARVHGYELAPACTGAPDLCGAPAGRPCEPGCPSRAAEVSSADALQRP